mmetsp:Transcript_13070/g.48538  ORF Transcript_13070/g.48538 Transcript_13070/m.48538 type:complete len:344 (-) Transcript_13070:377-1408(-)
MDFDSQEDPRGNGETRALGVMILLHGSGSNGDDFRSLVGPSLTTKLRGLGWQLLFPTAPERPYSLADGEEMHVWHDRQTLGPESPEDTAGLSASIAMVEEQIRDACAQLQVPVTNTVVGGFSMGGGLALACSALLSHRLAGVFSVGSFLARDSVAYQTEGPGQTDDIMMIHGNSDLVVDVDYGRETFEQLKKLRPSAHIRFLEHQFLDHDFSPAVRKQILEFAASITAALAGNVVGGEKQDEEQEADVSESVNTVTWELLPQTSDGRTHARFRVPIGSEAVLSKFPVNANGGQFLIVTGPSPGTVECEFVSPKPEVTAEAISSRLQARLQDPSPPGMDACCVA